MRITSAILIDSQHMTLWRADSNLYAKNILLSGQLHGYEGVHKMYGNSEEQL